MSKEADNFLRAEQSAQDLVEALTQLKGETVSYKTSTKELDAVRQKLVELIDSVQAVAKDSHEVIHILKEIGGPEILRSTDGLSKKLDELSFKHSQQLQRLRVFVIVALSTSVLSLIGIVMLLLR
ncbi:MAG TPA: hypothetical protein VI935_12275 [Thermodesulfobacteriota bacterium]|nr:hypothetical protein [Thermodesulfobacteriota bacterium]